MSDQEQKQEDFNGVMLGLVEFKGETFVGVKVGNGQINLLDPRYMLKVYDQLGEILYSLNLLDEDEGEDVDDFPGMVN